MDVVLNRRGNRLLAAHCAAFDPDSPTARARLDEALGAELANKLVFALAAGPSRPRAETLLRSCAVFAA